MHACSRLRQGIFEVGNTAVKFLDGQQSRQGAKDDGLTSVPASTRCPRMPSLNSPLGQILRVCYDIEDVKLELFGLTSPDLVSSNVCMEIASRT